MKIITSLFLAILLFACSSNTRTDQNVDVAQKSNLETKGPKSNEIFNFKYDKSKVSDFSIIRTEDLSMKALEKKLSQYSPEEIDKLPINKKLLYSIVVPTNISKESLENTLKHIVYIKTQEDNEIDEIIIYAYDNKSDIGIGTYNMGSLVWAPKGKLGNVTAEIAAKNNRADYKFDIEIKDRVGAIIKKEVPSKKELAIYDMIMAPENSTIS